MRLSLPFCRLPVRFDVERLRAEVAALPPSAWAKHPNDIPGNTSLRLISVGGAENDDVDGDMLPTPHLQSTPYIKQVLASFGVVWSRSRLLRLAPGANVPQHSDINYHWYNRVRVHIPIVTRPEVKFHCEDECVHMAAGEAWIFDNWRQHRVENPTAHERIHLVADTSGSAAFWRFAASAADPATPTLQHKFDSHWSPELLTEHTVLAPIMNPAEVDLLVMDLCSELAIDAPADQARTQLTAYNALLAGFRQDWRQCYALYGDNPATRDRFVELRDALRAHSLELSEGVIVRSNRVAAHKVLEGRVLRVLLPQRSSSPTSLRNPPAPHRLTRSSAPILRRPVFIIAAPRSGSTLLFETLAASEQLATVGGEAHWLIEGRRALQTGAPGVESNRLTAAHATPELANDIMAGLLAELRDARGVPTSPDSNLRILEKTPKNALRIPFLNAIFPDAQFVFLWRDPRQNISSIIEAWKSGRWKTYNGLPGFDGPWSLLLPPGWASMNQKPLEEIAAYQWAMTNRIVLDDLAILPRDRWHTVVYENLVTAPHATIAGIIEFAGLTMDAPLTDKVSRPLPLSQQTHTAPNADKWRHNQELIERVLPSVQDVWKRLTAF